MAELLHIIAESYDYPQLTEDVLREVSDKEFDSMDKKGPTSVSAFLIKISELIPEVVMKQMISLAKLVDSEVSFLWTRVTTELTADSASPIPCAWL